jgi:hypothetical protein
MIGLFLLGYIIPLIIVFSICYFSDDVLTRRDLLSWWWTYLVPVLNIYVILIFALGFTAEFIESKIDKDWWNNFLDKRL